MEELRRDPVMADLVAEHGPITLTPADDSFERLVVSILNQQVSTASANAIRERVFDRFDITPEGLLSADDADLKDAGLSRQKVRYVNNVAEAFAERDLRRAAVADWTDEEVVAALTDITGVGEWTAQMYLIFALGREDVFPVGDLAVRRAMEQLYGEMTRAEMVEKATDWRPYRSIGTLYLWRHYES